MKKFFLLCLVLSFHVLAGAQTSRTFDVDLWQDGLPNSNGRDNQPEDMSKSVFTPSIRVFLPDSAKATGRAVVACPGGGYAHLALDHEGYQWAPFFNEKGIALIVLKYRMPFGHKEVPASDAMEAIRQVRLHAEEWHINPYDVGIMGSSAGGHLASTVANMAPFAVRPDFQILFYPVITMDPSRSHLGSVHSLLGRDASAELQRQYSNELNVRRHQTPPAILLLSDDDDVVPSSNSVNYYSALRQNDVPSSLHIYPSGGHGWGVRSSFAYHTQMLADLEAWLDQLPSPRKDAVRVACVGNSITDGFGINMTEVNSYPAQLGRLLGPDYHVRNFGFSARTLLRKGDLPYMNEKLYEDSKAFNPDVVIIKLGTNDTKPQNWKHKADFEKDLQFMIDEYSALPSKPKIFLVYPIKVFKDNFGISDSLVQNGVIPLIRKVARKNKLQTIDLYSAFENKGNLMISDGIHPNREGAKVMAEVIGKAITDSYPEH